MVEWSDTYAVIFIRDTHIRGFGVVFTSSHYRKNVLTLRFDDFIRRHKVLFFLRMR